MSDTRDALIELTKSPGWQLFAQHCAAEWGIQGTRYHAEMDKALNLTDPAQAHVQCLQIRATRRLMETLLEWPAQEIARLGRTEADPVGHGMARGGYTR